MKFHVQLRGILQIGMLQLCTILSAAQSYQDLFSEAATLSAAGDYQNAVAKYEAALRIRPDAPEALSNLGVMYHAAGRYSEAVDILQRAVRLQPKLVPANLILGITLIQMNRPGESLLPLERVLAEDPNQRDAILGLASAQVALQDLPAAVIFYRRAIANNPRDHDAWFGSAVCFERMAEAASRRLAQIRGGAEYHKRLLGEYMLQRREDRLALEALDEASALSHADLKPVPEATALYEEARKLAEQSREAFLTFATLAPDSWQSLLFLGDLYRQQRNFPESLKSYESAAKLQPHNPAPLLGMGTVYWELGENEKAEGCLERVLTLDSKNSQALYELGNIALRLRKDEAAIHYLQSYLAIQPDQLIARADLGKAYLHVNRFMEAAAQLEKALQVDRQGDIHFQLATALQKLRRGAEAAQAFAESKRIRDRELEREQQLRRSR